MVHKAEGGKRACKRCGSGHLDYFEENSKKLIACLDCGWEEER